ncbi:laccase [Gymnopilus junonius]|uniref:laccase n=1 Tax=Gymnopilus junonius TaxID=109634 RepID=A0A9P5TIH0_GYMJU|nr:laccase [Gymnopilus junonius]
MLSTSFVLLRCWPVVLVQLDQRRLVHSQQLYPADGYNRSAVLAAVNETTGLLPGPLISGNKGDTFNLNVVNELSDTTMHWHGFFQHGSNWADGPVGVNQCPIIPGDSFLYQFSVPDQAGTFWYHSHHSTQYCDGLRGPFVVYDPDDPYLSQYDFDDESTVITLSDWYHETAPSLAGTVPTADSTLINGLGRYVGGPASPLSVFTVLPNKRYRFRLVSLSCDPNFVFSIDGHNLTIIEVDSVNVEPLVVDSIQIFAGQRYSFILETNQTVSNYWVRAMPNAGSVTFDGGINSAILRYFGADQVDPTTTQALSNPMVETNLHPLTNAAAPGNSTSADVSLNFAIGFDFAAFQFNINGATFIPPSVPVLLQILSGAQTAQDLLPSGSVYVIPPNAVIEISIPGGSVGNPHPFHLHGHTFSVVRSAGSSVYNYDNPVQRDVVSTGVAGDNVTIRFETNNVGPWIMHCHIDWHLSEGLAVVFAEDVPDVNNSSIPTAWDDLCPTYNAYPTQSFT